MIIRREGVLVAADAGMGTTRSHKKLRKSIESDGRNGVLVMVEKRMIFFAINGWYKETKNWGSFGMNAVF
jgi:hypothetical protein